MQLSADQRKLTVATPTRRVVLDPSAAVRATLYDRSLDRSVEVSAFEACLVQPLAEGVRVHLVSERHGLIVPVVFESREDGFSATVKAGEIVEEQSSKWRVMRVDVLPDLMATRVGDEGFYLLPDFSGTLVRFVDHAPAVTRDPLYMRQSQWEKITMLNCFGVSHGEGSTLAMVHRGDFFCDAVTEVNRDGVNRIYASFGVRHKPAEPIKQEDKQVIVRLLPEPHATYFDMARAYREYLIRDRGVSPLKQRVGANEVLDYSTRAMRVKIFHARKPQTDHGDAAPNVYASFEQSERILERMKRAGIDRAVVTLVGWNLGGHDGAYPQRFPVEPALGGEAGLRKLIAKAKSMGYQIVPHDNLTDMYLGSGSYDRDAVVRDEDGEAVLGGGWAGGQAVKSCPVAYFDRYGSEVGRVAELGFEGHYYCDAQSNPLYRCHDPRHPADEQQFGVSQCKLIQAFRVRYGAVAQELTPAYALPFVDEGGAFSPNKCARLVDRVDESLGAIVDRLVPFYQLAIHGLVTYQDEWVHSYRHIGVRKGLLRAIAFGARPSMEISYVGGANGDQYEQSIEDVIEGYRLAFEQLADTHVELVADYRELGPEAARIVYANGTAVTVNWGDEPVGDLEPWSCRIERGEADVRADARADGRAAPSLGAAD